MVFDRKSENYWQICYYGVIPDQDRNKDKTSATTSTMFDNGVLFNVQWSLLPFRKDARCCLNSSGTLKNFSKLKMKVRDSIKKKKFYELFS